MVLKNQAKEVMRHLELRIYQMEFIKLSFLILLFSSLIFAVF